MSAKNLDWSLWRSFLAILREGSLAAAARSLEVAHPTVRRHLEELESHLGNSLFVRSPSGLSPTELALSLRPSAQALEAAAGLLQRVASAAPRDTGGTVRIAASETIEAEILPPILLELKNRHPTLSFELSLSGRVEDLLRHEADIAVRQIRPEQDGLVARKLGTVELGMYAREDWLARYGEPASLADLIASGWLIGQDRGTAFRRGLSDLGHAVNASNFGFRCDNDLAQLAALRAGLGVGVCQKPLAAREPSLRPVLASLSHSMDIWLVTHPDLQSFSRVRATLDALAHGLRAYLGVACKPGHEASADRNG